MKKRPYTDAEIKTVHDMRKSGSTWDQVGEALGRNPKGVYSKFKLRAKRKYIHKTYRPQKPITETEREAPLPRPMIAFVGNPDEITRSIKELFS